MDKTTFIIISLLFSLNSEAQSITKKDFLNTDWFAENIDSMFFKEDTIRMVQRTNHSPDWGSDKYAESEMDYFNHGSFINFRFNRFGGLEHWATRHNSMNIVPISEFTWRFEKKKQILILYRSNVILVKLKPISKRQVNIKSKYAEHNNQLGTIEMTLIRVE